MDFDSRDAVAADQTTTPATGEQPFQFDSTGATEASVGNEFKHGISAGVDSAQGALYGLAGLAGDAVGLDGVRDWGLAGYQRNQEEGAANAPAVGTYRDIGGVRDAALYAAGGLGALVPFAATSLASAGAGGLVAAGAKVAARKGAERFAQSRLAQGVAAAAGRLPSAATGAKLGALANSIGTEQGLIYGDIHEKTGEYAPGTAAAYGAAAGALDVLPELRLAGKILNRGGKAATERFAPGLAKQMGLEGSTEVGQTALENLAVQDVDPSQRAFDGDNLHQMVDAGIIGALGGGAAHTIGHGYTRIAGVPAPVPDGPLARAATVAAPATPALPAPERLGLPAPDTLYTGVDGQTSTVGPNINVDGTVQPAPQSGQAFVAPENRVRPLGGAGMEQQVGEIPLARQGEYQEGVPAQGYRPAELPPQGEVYRGELVDNPSNELVPISGTAPFTPSGLLPQPDAFTVDSEGQARRGGLAPQDFTATAERQNPGMDQPANSSPRPAASTVLDRARSTVAANVIPDAVAFARETGASIGVARRALRNAQAEVEVQSTIFKSAPGANKVLATLPEPSRFEVVKSGEREWKIQPKRDQVRSTGADTFDDSLAKGDLRERIKQKRAEKRQSKPAEPSEAPRRGEVGGKLAAGEVVTTATGRSTTPFPAFKTHTRRKAINTAKVVDRWLMQNAHDEAAARGDEFARRQFEQNLDRPQQADKDMAEEYLFGTAPIAPQRAPMLKPLAPRVKPSASAQREQVRTQRREEQAAQGEIKAETRPAAEKPTSEPAGAAYGESNRLVSKDRAAEIRAKLKAKLNGSQLNSGLDPEILSLGAELAVFHIEAGIRTFAAFARTMAQDLDMPLDKVRPFLRSWYNSARDMLEDHGESIEGMDTPEQVRTELAKLTNEPAPTGATQSIVTPAGRELLVRPKVVEAADLVASNDDGGAINPAYPQHLQPRDRTRASSEMQVNDLAANMNPRLLGLTSSATDGAPIVGPDNVVESGNGRTMAIRRAYARNLPSAGEYRAWLKEQGHQVDGMNAPVLVRERVTALDDEQRRAFTVEANERTTLTQSASERALQDARELDGIIDQYRGGDVGAVQNQGFVRAFMRDVVAKADQGAMMDADGLLSQDGRRRMEAALMAAAYQDPGVVAELFENSDNDIRSIGGALLDVSGSWAQMRQEARAGQIPAGMDITTNVLEAVNLVRKARASGRPVAELVNQNDIFAGDLDPITQTVVSWFYRGEQLNRARGRDKVADILRDYVTTARAAQPGDNMFGDPEPTGAQVVGATRDKVQRNEQRSEQQAGQQGGLFGASGFGGGVRTRGDARQGSEPGQARPATETGGVDVPGTAGGLERDRLDREAPEPVLADPAGLAAGGNARATAQPGAGTGSERRAGQRDNQLPDDGAAAGRARSDQPVHQRDGQLQPSAGTARGADGAGSRSDRPAGSPVERQRERALAQDADTARAELERRKAAQRKANDSVPTTRQADPDEIARALPLLLEPQRDDVLKAETRFQNGNGMLFTNGTGTGKTASGLGVAKRFANAGRDNILVVVPSDKIASDWVNFGAMLGMDLTQLASTDDNGGSGPIVTTYANFGANRALAKRDWDLVIPDEAHYLSSAQDGERTDALSTLRALTGHHDGFYRWIRDRYSREYDALQQAREAMPNAEAAKSTPPATLAKLEKALATASAKWDAIEQREAPKWRQRWERQQDLPKAVFLSATPFAYVKNVDWAEGYLFHYADPREQFGNSEQMRGYSYNSGDSRERFFMQHFGYRMRYNKLTAPEAGVNRELLEQNFNQYLQDTGALSGRRLDVPHDYDRKFVLIDAGIGKKIDEAFAYLNDESRAATERGDEQADLYRDVENATRKAFDYQSRMYLLEALKARAVVPLIKQHQALGRKVVVFHDYNKGGGFNPFERVIQQIASGQPARDLARQLFAARPDLFKLDFSGLHSPIVTLGAAFPDALFFNGTVPKAERRANADRFNDEAGEHRLIVLQSDAGREGVSLHDTTGKYPRVLINLGLPVRPVAATQIEGRTYRTGQASDAAFRYLTTGTSWEAGAFASKIAQRAATAENLALGAEARGLKQAFIDAYENANDDAPSAEDGRGGKEYDRAMSAGSLLSGFNKAKTYYYAQQKNTKRRDQRAGDDYYATPEPVGFKMVEWSGLGDGEKGLEPSAGHGAIARFFPPLADVTLVEPSYSLAERAALSNGGARIETMRFEDFPLVNKAHAVVMNPPYGRGGKTAVEHLAKAARHLYQGGRIVALIPRGGMVERYLSDFMASDAAKGLQEVATVALPGLAFERAGTSVNTQILVLEKTDRPLAPRSIDLSSAEDINELFDRLEHLEMPDRGPVEAAPAEAPAAPAPAGADTPKASPFRKAKKNGQKSGHITLNGQQYPVVEHITKGGKGNVIHGIIRPDLTQAQAKEIDAYTFKKDGGWFLRTEHLVDNSGTRYSAAPRPIFDTPPSGLKRDVFRTLASRLAAGTGIDVQVVDSVGDLPKAIREQIAADGTRATVQGIWHNGQVFLVASRLRDATHAAQIALHEIFGHAGVRAALGNRLDLVLDQIYRSLSPARVRELASLYAGQIEGMTPAEARRLIADEHLAQLAESNPRNGFVLRALAAIRKFAREVLRLPVRWSQAEMVDLLAQGRRALLERRAGAGTRYSQERVQESIQRVVASAKGAGHAPEKAHFAEVQPWVAAAAAEQGLNVTGYRHMLDGSAVRHILRKHGDAKSEVRRGQIAITDADFAQLPEVVASPDRVVFGTRNRLNKEQIIYIKRLPDGTMLYLEEVRTGRKELAAVSMRKYPATIHANAITATVDLNARDDGGNPSGITVVLNPNQDNSSPDIRYSVGAQPGDAADIEALRKLGLVPEDAKGVLARLREFVQGDMRAKLDALKARANEGIFDGLAGIRQAEEAVGITGERRGYVSARLATGLPDVMHGLLHYGAPEWKDGVLQHKAGTRGLLEILAELGGDNLTDWLAWVGAKRAELLATEGRENNLSPDEIQRLLAKAGARAPLFQQVYAEYTKFNTAMLDVAEQAGLISAKQRAGWMSDYYIPFYRMPEDEDGTSTLLAPTSKAGLSHQSAAIKRLTGGDIPTADLLSNILTNWSKRLDASMKNRALLDVVDNLKDTPYLEAEPNPGAPARAQGVGFARDRDDIIRVQRDGRAEYFKVKDKALLRAVTAMSGMYFKDPVTTLGRKFKRLLTTGVTAAPDFMLRNFLRDSAQAWITNPDQFKLGIDSVKGLRAAFAQDADYRALMFAGASFAGGYANAADPEATAAAIRRALKAKGLTKAQQDSYLSSLASTSGKLGDALAKGWEKYREIGERIENANRLATYKRAIEAGKSRRQAAFEAKDLMDFSMRGNFVALQWLTDVVPFLNARLQGLGKLGRSYRDDQGQVLRQVVMKAGMLAAFSLVLAALNGDDDRYKALPEWDKDANWHFWFSADQVEPIRIPKPFELGLLFGTLPERLLNVTAGNQDGAQLQGAIARGVVSTLAFNPIPQFYMPIRDIQANKSLYFGTPIESLADEGKLPAARYDSRTSEVAKALGQLTGPTLGLSPKQLDYLVKGYTGTLGAYVLSASDLVAHQFQEGDRPALTARQVPLLSVIYKGSSPGSTQYQTDLYDMVHEADEIYRTARAWRQEGRVEDARQLLEDNRDKVLQRGALGLARQQLGNIRAQREQVMRSTTLDAQQKRERLDELQRRENRIAERVVTRARDAFK